MIRILIADHLPAKTIDLLNEISEFEIIEKPDLASAQLQEEIKNADALVISGPVPISDEILKSGDNLKLIVRGSDASGPADAAAAKLKDIEIRTAVGHGTARAGEADREAAGYDVIAILKDFFNV